MKRKFEKGERVVDPKTGARGTVYAIQEANMPWHDGGCPLVNADREYLSLGLGHAWHHAVLESEAKSCSTCGGVLFTPTCNHDAHVEAYLVERIVKRLEGMESYGFDSAKIIEAEFHPRMRRR